MKLLKIIAALAACGDDDAGTTTATESPGDTGRVAVGPPITVEEALTAAADRPAIKWSITSRCPGRKRSNPKWRFSATSRSAVTGGLRWS